MQKVTVTANADEKVIVPSEKSPEYGYIRVEQARLLVDESTGWAKNKVLSALVLGTVATLELFGWKKGQKIEGKIVVKEQLTPFNEKDPDKDLKLAGDTLVICKSGEKPIYRKCFWVQDPFALDVLIPHTNGDEIRLAQEAPADVEDFDLGS